MIGIVGLGTVGQAYKSFFPSALGYDKQKHIGSKKAVNECKITFVCVPTPTNENGTQDISAVEDVLSWLRSPIIVLKSTVLPGTTRMLAGKYKKDLVFSPEFLGALTATEDMKTMPLVLCGEFDACQEVKKLFRGRKSYYFKDFEVGEVIKYAINSFLALKVSYMNQIYDACEKEGISYKLVMELGKIDKRVGTSHMMVTRERGYGGKCFPKDVKAFIHKYRCMTLLKEAAKYNEKIRSAN